MGNTFRVALCWAGNPNHKNDRNRSLTPGAYDMLFDLGARVEFVSVQKGAREDEYPAAQTVTVSDYLDTAHVINTCDAVVTVDTSVAHLAGAMGKPTHLLVAAVPDFRWLIGRPDTPWYDSVRIHRQDAPGTWTSAVASVKQALVEALERKEAA